MAEAIDFLVQRQQIFTARGPLEIETLAHAVDALLHGAARVLAGFDSAAGLFFQRRAGLDQIAKQPGRFHPGFFEPALSLIHRAPVGADAG